MYQSICQTLTALFCTFYMSFLINVRAVQRLAFFSESRLSVNYTYFFKYMWPFPLLPSPYFSQFIWMFEHGCLDTCCIGCLICVCFIFWYLCLFSAIEHVSYGKGSRNKIIIIIITVIYDIASISLDLKHLVTILPTPTQNQLLHSVQCIAFPNDLSLPRKCHRFLFLI